jgi:metallo-beta-lactamase family protein
MYGHYVPIRAHIHELSMLSAHGDRDELLRWAREFDTPPRTAFVVHGEPASADALRHALEEELFWNCVVPDHNQTVTLS